MTTEGTKKHCTHTGCDGKMTYSATKRPPGSQEAFHGKAGNLCGEDQESPEDGLAIGTPNTLRLILISLKLAHYLGA